MFDFEAELNKLLAEEGEITRSDEFELLAGECKRILSALDKKQVDVSLQIEEIFDIVQENGNHREELRSEQSRAERLRDAVIGFSDMVDDFIHFAAKSGNAKLETQARLMRKNAEALLERCGLTRIGKAGQLLDVDLHSVQAAEASEYPRGHIASVLQSGYRYMGAVIRKASVIVSAGTEGKPPQIKEENSDRSPGRNRTHTPKTNGLTRLLDRVFTKK